MNEASRNFSFSVKTEEDRELVNRVKKMADKRGMNLSFIVIRSLAKWEKDNVSRRS